MPLSFEHEKSKNNNIFFLQSVCMELWQRLNWGISRSYECTLGDWMLSKINNNQIGGKEEHIHGVKLQ